MRAFVGLLSMLGVSAGLALSASAATIACPAGPLHSEIVDAPGNWTPVPIEGALSGAELRGAIPDFLLVCKYGPAGEITLVPPAQHPICRKLTATSFDCRAPINTGELGPPIGSLKLVEGDKVDLDTKPSSKTTSISTSFISSKAVDFIFANFVNTTNQPGYDAENGAKIAVFTRRFPIETECPLNGGSSSGNYFPLIDTATGRAQTGPMFSCVTTAGGKWYVTQLTEISRSDGKTRATLTWWNR